MTPDPGSLDFILQRDVTSLLPSLSRGPWLRLYLSGDQEPHRFGLWCALMDDAAAASATQRESWDLSIGDGLPGFSQSWQGEREVTTYHPFGSSDGVRPFVLYRSFHGAFPRYVEIAEEFRLFHNLAEDEDRSRLLTFDASGREIEVVRTGPTEVQAQFTYVQQFQAATRLSLAVYVDSVRYSQLSLGEIPREEHDKRVSSQRMVYMQVVRACDFKQGYKTFSRILGKVLLPAPPLSQAGVWPFESEDHRDVGFIIGLDEFGQPVEFTSDPDKLSNYFGANPGAPHYLTPVFFRREVLGKYYSEPARYEVGDGLLRCLGLWTCQIDNDLDSHVSVFLGDLGRDLPYEERLHWRQFNIAAQAQVSETNFRRSFLAQFTDPKAADLTFRQEYSRISTAWKSSHGWPLYLPLAEGDEHILTSIRVPLANSQSELDEQVGFLAKLLVDSLNEQELAQRAGQLPEGAKGLAKLDAFLGQSGFMERKTVVQFLRDLQTLRSTGSAHRKGAAYEAIVTKLGVNLDRKPEVMRRLFEQSIAALRALRLHHCAEAGGHDTGKNT